MMIFKNKIMFSSLEKHHSTSSLGLFTLEAFGSPQQHKEALEENVCSVTAAEENPAEFETILGNEQLDDVEELENPVETLQDKKYVSDEEKKDEHETAKAVTAGVLSGCPPPHPHTSTCNDTRREFNLMSGDVDIHITSQDNVQHPQQCNCNRINRITSTTNCDTRREI